MKDTTTAVPPPTDLRLRDDGVVEWRNKESVPPKIHAAMIAVMRDVDFIGKDRQASGGGPSYRFRGIDDIYNAIHPLLAKHGIFMLASYKDRNVVEKQSKSGNAVFYVTLTGVFRFTAEDGSYVECSAIGEAMDNSDKATNKAMSVALKYAVMQTFFIPTEESKDPENDHIEVKPTANVGNQLLTEMRSFGIKNAAQAVALYRFVLAKDKPENDTDRKAVIEALLEPTKEMRAAIAEEEVNA